MQYDGLLAHVRACTRAGEYASQRIPGPGGSRGRHQRRPGRTGPTHQPARRISPREVEDLASRLPGPLGRVSDRAARSRRRGSAAPWLEPAQGAHVQLHDARPLRPVGQGRPHVQPSGGFSSRRIRVGAVAHTAGEVSSSASGASSTSGTTRSRPAHPPELPSAAPWTWTRPSAAGLRDRCGRRGSGARRGLHRLFRSALTAGGRRRLGPRPSAASGGSSGRDGES